MYGPFIMQKMWKEGIPMTGRKPKPTVVKSIRQITRLPKKVSPPDRGGES